MLRTAVRCAAKAFDTLLQAVGRPLYAGLRIWFTSPRIVIYLLLIFWLQLYLR